jgi:hypothetical protein
MLSCWKAYRWEDFVPAWKLAEPVWAEESMEGDQASVSREAGCLFLYSQ